MTCLSPTVFGVLSDGRPVTEYYLRNRHGLAVSVLDYGGIIRTLDIPDRYGEFRDVVLGFDGLDQYEGAHPYFGAIIGRVAGRIGRGRLPLAAVDYQLVINDPPNHLHGGSIGFDHKLWSADFSAEKQSLILSYESPDGEEGYPGTLAASVAYSLTDSNELIVDYQATTDEPTAVNLTQHSYFNLSGDLGRRVTNHTLSVNSDRVLELDESSIPTGRILNVRNSRFDLRSPQSIGSDSSQHDGYDNYWILADEGAGQPLKLAVSLRHEVSGREIQVYTSEPGIQIYTGNALPDGIVGKGQIHYGPMQGICLETQTHPDSPNRAEFPSIFLEPGSEYASRTVFHFLVAS